MLALFAFGKSSEKLYAWFLGTKLYHKHLESFAKGQGMTTGTKCKIIAIVTLLMGVGFFLMRRRTDGSLYHSGLRVGAPSALFRSMCRRSRRRRQGHKLPDYAANRKPPLPARQRRF